jgi:mannan endo-1,4-beta-mannosidase
MNEAGLVGLDRLLDAAREARVKLVLVLANYWTDYGGIDAVLRSVAPGETPARDAFWTDSRAIEAQQRYITALVTRVNTLSGQGYAADTTILAWELVNEARCEDRSACDATTLVTWAQTMTDSVRAAGAQQLVAWGGAGHAGEHGEDFEAIAASGAVDVLTLHVYPESTQPELLVGLHGANRARVGAAIGSATITDRARLARRFGRPLLVEELGWHPSNGDAADHERAWVMAQWMATAQQESVGTLPWMIAEHGREDHDGLLIRPWQDIETATVLGCSQPPP